MSFSLVIGKIQTCKRLRIKLFIRTKHCMQYSRVIPFIKLQNKHLNNKQTVKTDEKWHGELIHLSILGELCLCLFGSCFRMLAVISDFCDWSIFSSPWLVNIFFALTFAFLGRLSLSALALLLDHSWTPCEHPLARHACGRWKRWNRMRPRALVQN